MDAKLTKFKVVPSIIDLEVLYLTLILIENIVPNISHNIYNQDVIEINVESYRSFQ